MVKLLGSMTTFVGWKLLLISSSLPLAGPLYSTMTGLTVWACPLATSKVATSASKATYLRSRERRQFILSSQSLSLNAQGADVDSGGQSWTAREANGKDQVVGTSAGQIANTDTLGDQLQTGSRSPKRRSLSKGGS